MYKQSEIEAAGVISNPINQKDFGDIVTDDRIPVFQLALSTNVPGEYFCPGLAKDDYIVIAHAEEVTDYKHLGKIIDSEDENWGNGEIYVNLKLQTGKDKKDKNK